MKRILPTIVLSQFLCTSLWFAGNAIITDIASTHGLAPDFVAHLTSAVQFGFITGTLLFALLSISDRFSPSRVFFFCSLVAALVNLGVLIGGIPIAGLIIARFLTGFFLAGIYPVGMKIAADYYQKGLGKSLGLLVGALVLGTAFPHLLKSITAHLPWKYVIVATSSFSVMGGTAMLLLVPNGPYRRPAQGLKLTALFSGFRISKFRNTAFGYFGHMWELYAFWAFVPSMLTLYNQHHGSIALNVPLYSFLIIASGGPACAIAGYLSQQLGTKNIAAVALTLSGLCCLVSPIILFSRNHWIFLAFLLVWGLMVVADSPMFSSLIAAYAPADARGTSLTIVNCIGFSITIVSIQTLHALSAHLRPQYLYLILAIGPILGLVALFSRSYSSVASAGSSA